MEGRQHLKSSNVISYPTLCFTLREMIFLLVSMRHNPVESILAVSLSLEPSRGDRQLAINVTVVASSFIFRQFKISVSFRWS